MEEIYKSEDFRQKTLLAKKLNYYSNRVHEIHYSDLKELITNNELTPGMQYRIIDYKTTVSQSGCSTDERLFDVIVTALTPNTLDENARCCTTNRAQTNTDTLGKPEGWKIKYSVTNPSWCAWANVSVENGYKGTIYYMEDEFGNEAYYDFKTILYTSFTITNKNLIPYRGMADSITTSYSKILSAVNNYNTTGKRYGTNCILLNTNGKRHTFTYCRNYTTESTIDASSIGYAKSNKIYLANADADTNWSNVYLPFVILTGSYTITNNIFINSKYISIDAYHNPNVSINPSSNPDCEATDNGVITSNSFKNCSNVYTLGKRLYNCNFYVCNDSTFICWGTKTENYMYNCSMLSGSNNCIWCYAALKQFSIGTSSSNCTFCGTSIQKTNIGNDCDNLKWNFPDGYLLYTNIGNDCDNITINCGWLFDSTILSGVKKLTFSTASTASYPNPLRNVVLYPADYNNSNLTTLVQGATFSQEIKRTGSKVISIN